MTSLIHSDQIWLVWMVVIAMGAFAIFAEQKFKLGGKLGSAVIAIFGAMLLVNIRLIPVSSTAYDVVNGYILPLSIPLLLFKCDLRRIVKESGKLFIIFHVAAIGTMIGSVICSLVFRNTAGIGGVAAMSTGAYIGGTVNLVAMGQTFHMDATYINAVAIAANLALAILMVILGTAGNTKFIRRNYGHPHIDEFESFGDQSKPLAGQYWKPKEISLLSLSLSLAATFLITGVSQTICGWVNATDAPMLVKQLFGSIFLVMTLITVVLVTLFPKFFEKLNGAEEIGNFMIVLFFVALGCAANLTELLKVGTVAIVFILVIIVCNLGINLLAGKLFKWNYEDMACSSCATIGGPTTAAALAINKGWNALVVPSILVGLYGYIIGNYCGVFIGNLFS